MLKYIVVLTFILYYLRIRDYLLIFSHRSHIHNFDNLNFETYY